MTGGSPELADDADSGGRGPLGVLLGRHPAALLGGALGAGYLVGGGLGGRATGQLLRWGGVIAWRFVVVPLLEQAARGFLGRASAPAEDESGAVAP